MSLKPRLPGLSRGGWLNVGLAVVLAMVVVGAYTAIGAAAPTTTTGTRTATVTQGSLTATVSGSGNLASGQSASLAFGAAGTVQDVNVEVGDKVSKGDKLASIDTASAERSLASAKASLKAAQASYDEAVDNSSDAGTADAIKAAKLSLSSAQAGVSAAKKQLTNDTKTQNAKVSEAQDAVDAGTGTESQLLAAEAERDSTIAKDKQGITTAQAQVATARSNLAKARSGSSSASNDSQVASAQVQVSDAEASVSDAEDALEETKIIAPFSGTILSVSGAVGDTVSAGTSSTSSGATSSSSSSSSGTGSGTGTGTGTGSTSSSSSSSSSSGSAFITMADTKSLQMTADIAEADIGSVKVGQDVNVTLSASDETAAGTVTLVSPEGTTSSNVVQYSVTVTLTDPPATARIGSSATASITTGSVENALLLQTSAITTSGTRHTVTVVKNGATSTQQVETGLVGSTQTQITSGLAAGDTVQITSTSSTATSAGVPGFGGAGGGLAGGIGR
ncbi:efflux RND transporter periplasmic adaptor subunit [Spongisporangium articulatum]|uniref:Efflux RND transporter periplasmic adaptor subunit n=1 Tax=Spongisporangium articulatum TaxID=3362603 RepID=A0ABW8AJD0_9ACTN